MILVDALLPGTPVMHCGRAFVVIASGGDSVVMGPATFDDGADPTWVAPAADVVRLDAPAVFAHQHLLASAARRAGLLGLRVRARSGVEVSL